jgi:glycosyltransferase involved in cell wall biosynthesis
LVIGLGNIDLMRIAIVMGAKGWRGSVASFVKVAEGLARRGHEAHFLTAAGPVPERLRALGHEVVELGAKNTGPREVWALHRVLRDRGIGAIYADTPRDLRLSAYATRLRACPVAYRYNVNARPPRGDFGDKLFARAVSALVVLSRWVEERVALQEPWLAARPTVRIPNGFDTELFSPDPAAGAAVRQRLGLGPEVPTVLCASVFAPGKRQGFLLDALHRLRERRPGRVACLLAGGDEESATFREEARVSGVEIHWLGRPAPEELPGIYAAADVVAQPSDIESFGNVIGEAMACGRAVVVPDAGAAAEVAGEGAVVVAAHDADRWAAAIGELIAAPDRRTALGLTARQRIVQEFPLSRMQDAHTALFERLGR